ncbi:MAG: alpha/beta hydrolase [Patescibacteria group bacterium]
MKVNRKIISISVLIFVVITIPAIAHYKTGVFSPDTIDETDKIEWEHNKDGLIAGQDSFVLDGSREQCWLLIHSYTSTPDEMRELANVLNEKFGEYISAPRLKGHAKLPSELEDLSLRDWYDQIEVDYVNLSERCEGVSVVGSSIGGIIAIRLAEDHEVDSVYAVNSFFNIPYNFYYVLKPEVYLEFLGPHLHYVKKNKTGRIADPEGGQEHFSYLNLPLEPIINSKQFFIETKKNLDRIKEPIFIAHSTEDPVSSFEGVREAYEMIPSEDKKFLKVRNSEHILLRDYDKLKIIKGVIKFEKSLRQ